jgi:hypothetical protein
VASKAKRVSIADDVLGRAANYQPGFVAWHCKLPPDVLAELESLRARWANGEIAIQKRALARAIIETCRERGLHVSGVQGVEHWLNATRKTH